MFKIFFKNTYCTFDEDDILYWKRKPLHSDQVHLWVEFLENLNVDQFRSILERFSFFIQGGGYKRKNYIKVYF